jgi:hypothetical protein
MSEIPDLASEPGESRYVTAKKQTSNISTMEEPIDSAPVETQDNQFVWFALVLITIILGSLVWLSIV